MCTSATVPREMGKTDYYSSKVTRKGGLGNLLGCLLGATMQHIGLDYKIAMCLLEMDKAQAHSALTDGQFTSLPESGYYRYIDTIIL